MEKMRNLRSVYMVLFSIILFWSPRFVQAMEFDTDRPGMDYKSYDLLSPDPNLCERACKEDPNCKAWTYVKPGIQGPKARCWLKSGVPQAVKNTSCISGIVQQTPLAKPSGQQIPGAVTKEGTKQAGPQPRPENVKLARDHRKRMADFEKNWRAQIRQIIGNANQKLRQAQLQHYEKTVQTLRTAKMTATPLSKKAHPKVIEERMKEIAATPLKKQAVAKKLQPKITKITGLVGNKTVNDWKENDVEEGSYVQIYGENFGDYVDLGNLKTGSKACGVALEYGDAPKEFQKAGPLNHRVDLIPLDGDWNKCWRNTGIIATLPIFPESAIQIVGNLVVWGQGFILKHPVQILRAGPGITYFTTAPEFNDRVNRYGASSGGQISVYGVGFGNQPGKIYLELPDPIGSLKQIALTPTSWTDSNIIADIPKVPGNYPFQIVRLNVLNTQLNRLSYTSIQFGPKMIYTLVNGLDFLELATPGDQHASPPQDRVETEGPVLLVIHDPGCGVQGNNGNDYFFRNKPLPPGCMVVKAAIAWTNPDDDMANLKKAGNEILDWIKAASGGFVDLAKKFGEYVVDMFAGMFGGPGVGSYLVSVQKQPTPSNPSLTIHWENTCYSLSPVSGVPITYTASFMLWGPEGTVPGTATN